MSRVSPFVIEISQAALDDLDARLARTRWPREEFTPGWDEGTDNAFLTSLVAFWRDSFDWRLREQRLNEFAQFRADIDGARIHFVYERGRAPDSIPLILTHGWPSTFYELLPLVRLLTDRFDVVIPSLPGYAFSDPLGGPGSANRVPALWDRLMRDVLGYDRYAAHGGDIGSMITNRLAYEFPDHLLGIHVALVAEPNLEGARLSAAETDMLAARIRGHEVGGAYAHVQRTRPQTLAYSLTDSPVGLAAWILDKWWAWSDCGDDLHARFSDEQLLTTVMLFWLTGTIGSSFRFYRDWALGSGSRPEAWHSHVPCGIERPLPAGDRIRVPTAVNLREARFPREWAERAYAELRRFTVLPRGGHFAALAEPDMLAADIRSFFS